MLLHPPHEDVEQEKQQEHDLNRDADRTNDQKMMNIELLPRYSMAVKELCEERRKNKKLKMEIDLELHLEGGSKIYRPT